MGDVKSISLTDEQLDQVHDQAVRFGYPTVTKPEIRELAEQQIRPGEQPQDGLGAFVAGWMAAAGLFSDR